MVHAARLICWETGALFTSVGTTTDQMAIRVVFVFVISLFVSVIIGCFCFVIARLGLARYLWYCVLFLHHRSDIKMIICQAYSRHKTEQKIQVNTLSLCWNNRFGEGFLLPLVWREVKGSSQLLLLSSLVLVLQVSPSVFFVLLGAWFDIVLYFLRHCS